jgi:hypothetical protein
LARAPEVPLVLQIRNSANFYEKRYKHIIFFNITNMAGSRSGIANRLFPHHERLGTAFETRALQSFAATT